MATDGDSQMASSPESSHLPSEGSRTPTNPTRNSRSHFAGASELSPPGSQPQNPPVTVAGMTGSDTIGAEGASTTANPDQQQQQQPGASWMNKRADEEYQRAMEYLVDKEFSLDEFGDPFDERDMQEKLF